jgi:Zn-dependent protease
MQACPKCSQQLAAGALVCDKCRALVYANELQHASELAKSAEAKQQYREARDYWQSALRLLPESSKQAAWIRDHLEELDRTGNAWEDMGGANESRRQALKASVVAFLFSFAAFVAFESFYGGFAFGVGFSVLILLHEFGHFIDVHRRGMKADLPIFLPGLGAFVRFRSLAISREVRAGVSLAGPFAGFLSAALCGAIWYATGNRYWASLAQSGAWLNLLNLTPVWVLDGGQAASALSKSQRVLLLATAIILWAVTRESLFFVVVIGAAYRVFVKDLPPQPSSRMTLYFLVTMILLAAVLYLVPGKGFGIQ